MKNHITEEMYNLYQEFKECKEHITPKSSDLYKFLEYCPKNDLKFLCEQKVLLGNRALNCKLNKTGSFMGKWDFFWEFFLQEIVFNFYKGVPIILVGKDAAKLKKYVFEMNNPVFILDHTSFAARNNTLWETNNVFTKANKLVVEQFGQGTEIIWDKKIYDEIKELPF